MIRYRLVGLGMGAVAMTLALAGPAAAATSSLQPPTISADSTTLTVGTAATFRFGTQAGSVVPVQFLYQLNEDAPVAVDATNGRAKASIVPTRFTNLLTVYALGPDGALSDPATDLFTAAFPPPAADQDLTGDGKPDLLTVGGMPGLASGLWMAPGQTGSGMVSVPALDIGINGNGIFGGSPADFDGAQVITGKLTGISFEDVLVYYPSGLHAGSGVIIGGNGHGRPLDPVNNSYSLFSNTFTDLNGDNPIQLASAYNSAGSGLVIPDLFGIVGDPTNGYTLDYYRNLIDVPGLWDFPIALAIPTPTGGTDWQNWRIFSKLLPSGTALALWNPTTGGLYLWEGVTFNADTGALSFTQYTLATAWQPTPMPSALQLTDVNADGVPDVWAVTPAGDVTAYVVSELSTTTAAELTARPAQNLS